VLKLSELEYSEKVFRTSSGRTAKMFAIVMGMCIVGGVIFFAQWDYWISQQPPVAMSSQSADSAGPAVATGKDIPTSLSFVESSDFRTLAFNALPGEPDNNPTIQANVGDKIIFDVINDGKSFHAFGVTKSEEGFSGIISGSEVASASNPLKPGEAGQSEFIPSEEGTYYYICTVPGHREQGMVGEIIVEAGSSTTSETAAPTGVSHEFELDFVESDDFRILAFNALPGEEGNNPEIMVNSGDSVTIQSSNNGKSFHAFGVVTDPEDFNSIVWGSSISSASNPLKPGESGEVTFTAGAPGIYYYICTVPGHALQGMQGKFIVSSGDDVTSATEMVMLDPTESELEIVESIEPEIEQIESDIEVSNIAVEPISEIINPFSGIISVPSGSAVPGCEETNECYIPSSVSTSVGETITWSNDDSAAHTVTSGTPSDGPDGIFDSSLFMAGTTFSYTFDQAGEYNYFCMVHPWMVGTVQVG